MSNLQMDVSIPAGSFKCDKLVRSSAASNIGGFIKGGSSESSLFPSSTSRVVSFCIFYLVKAV